MYLKWTRNFIIRLCLLVYSSSSKRGRGLSGGISSSSSLWSSFVGPRAHTLPWEMIIIKRSSSCCCYSPVAVPALLLLLLPTHYVFSTSLPPLANPLFCVVLFQWLPKELPDFIITPRKMKMTLPFKNASSYSTHIDIFFQSNDSSSTPRPSSTSTNSISRLEIKVEWTVRRRYHFSP